MLDETPRAEVGCSVHLEGLFIVTEAGRKQLNSLEGRSKGSHVK